MKSAPIGHYIDHHSLTSLSWTFSGICSNDPLFFRINTQSLLIYHINTKADRETNACFVFISVRCQDTVFTEPLFILSFVDCNGKKASDFRFGKNAGSFDTKCDLHTHIDQLLAVKWNSRRDFCRCNNRIDGQEATEQFFGMNFWLTIALFFRPKRVAVCVVLSGHTISNTISKKFIVYGQWLGSHR